MDKSLSHFSDIKEKIYTIRGKKVMLDRDLAGLYGVKTKRLNEQVRRNIARFPEDFMFQLTEGEVQHLWSQNATANISPKSRTLPHVFTEYGTIMLSSILNSSIAIQVNQTIIRVFIELRHVITTVPEHSLLKEKLNFIESRMDTIEANHLVDNTVLSGKITQLSQDTQDLRSDLNTFSQLLDEMQSSYIVIKRPEEGNFDG